MIKISDMLSEFILSLGEKFNINYIDDNGVSFYYKGLDLKFSIVNAPMFGVPNECIGLIISDNSYPLKDSYYHITDPNVFNKLSARIKKWSNHPDPSKLLNPQEWDRNSYYSRQGFLSPNLDMVLSK